MAHVTSFTFQALPGRREAVLAHFDRWRGEMQAGATGFQMSVLVADNQNPEKFTSVVMFDSTENYQKNSDRPATGQWFQGLRADLVADPVWFDGTVVGETRA